MAKRFDAKARKEEVDRSRPGDADADGAGAAVLFAVLKRAPALVAGDIVAVNFF